MSVLYCELCGLVMTDTDLDVTVRHGVQICAECAADIDEWETADTKPIPRNAGHEHVWTAGDHGADIYCAICGESQNDVARP